MGHRCLEGSKNELTKKYAQTMLGWGQKIQIRFTKVPAHSKVKYNELADETAKLGVANGNGVFPKSNPVTSKRQRCGSVKTFT